MGILEKIQDLSPAAGKKFTDYGFANDSDFEELVFDSLSEFFPEKTMQNIKLKSKVWTIIRGGEVKRAEKDLSIVGQSSPSIHSNSSSSSSIHSSSPSINLNQSGYASSSTRPCFTDEHSLGDERDTSPIQRTLDIRVVGRNTKKVVYGVESDKENDAPEPSILNSQLKGPIYDLYHDPVFLSCPDIPEDILHTVARAQINIMMTASFQPPFSRYPTTLEIEDVSEALTKKYPVFSKHNLLQTLKNRLKNVKSNRKDQKRPYKKRRLVTDGNLADSESEPTAAMKKKVTEWLADESNKKKQDDATMKILLKKEYESRRVTISSLTETNGDLVTKVLELYPVFKNYRYIINEAILMCCENTTIGKLEENLCNLLDPIIYYSIQRKDCKPPGKVCKFTYVMNNLQSMFTRGNKKRSPPKIIQKLQAKTDLEMLQSHNVTKILLCQDEIVILSCGKILTRLGVDDIGLAIITMFSHFYLLDLNYPACWWAVFTFIQFAIFGEKEEESVQEQFRDQWKKEWKEFTSYLSSREEEEVLDD